jgi:hypothetical protein
MLLQPDADGSRPQVAAVICRFRIFRSTSHWEHVLRQEPRDRLDLDCMHTGIDKAWVHRETQQCLQRRTVQPALQLGVAVLCRTWAGWPGKQLYGAVGTLYCSIYAAAHWTDLRSARTGTGSQTINRQREMLQAGSKAISHKVLAMSAVPVVLHSMSLLSDSGIRDAQ